ncbi:hypothetical protein Glove_117g129 [Diversispora epigaea]|uniref:Protein kinase domain-containing protein n=1 Tax=Diversispora epigaea TaxID=1348612 RepID=A0A397J6T2_9GLOM|nr:hypothetical protein Glove_117g129 [Diversispora epigaea]
MSLEKTNEKKWKTLMRNLIIEDTFQKEKIPFYQYSEFVNVKSISKNVYEATFKTSQKIIVLKCISLNDKFTLDNLINEIKRYRKLEIHDSILKFYGITRQENINNYMIILEYVNKGSLRQYLKTNFQKLDWKTKLNLAKQIANVLMHLHANNIIHGKFNSENILIHNGIIKLNVFGLTKIISDFLSFLINNLGSMQCMDPQHLDHFSTIGKNKSSDIFGLGIILWEISTGNSPFEMRSSSNVDLLNNITKKRKREMAISETPQKYEKIYTDCLKHNGNSRPDISQVVKNLSEIIISDATVEFGTIQSQPYNVTDAKLENLNIQSEKFEIKPYSPLFNVTTEVNVFIKDLFELLNDLFNRQFREIRPFTIRNYIREHKKNPVEILSKMISHESYYCVIFSTDCLKHNGNSRPDISQVVKNLSEIIISDATVEFGTIQSQPYNVTDAKLENLNIQSEKFEIKPYSPLFNVTTEVNVFIKDLFELLNDLFNRQFREIRPFTIRNYIREHKKNPVEILSKMISHESYYWFTSLIGFFYQHGIGTVVDNQMAFKFYNLAANDISSSNSSSFRELYNINKEIGNISLAQVYLYGLGVDKNAKKTFQICYKLAYKGSLMASNSVAYCYSNGFGVEKNEEKAFELYLKSAENGFLLAQFNVGWCYDYGKGITKDKAKGFQWVMKSARAGNINAMCNVGYSYENGIGVCKDKKEAFKWYLKAAEKEHNASQYNIGLCYNYGRGIDRDYKKAFEWLKKAAENNFTNSQYMLGKLFYEGNGTKKDIVNAIYWLNKAKENGNTDANELLEEIISNII